MTPGQDTIIAELVKTEEKIYGTDKTANRYYMETRKNTNRMARVIVMPNFQLRRLWCARITEEFPY